MHFCSTLCLFVLAVTTALPRISAQEGQGIFVTPIANMPFHGVVHIEKSVVNPNGSVSELKSVREVARDGRGRIHNEFREFVKATSNKTPQPERIHLFDPQTRTSTYLNPQRRTYFTRTGDHPPAAFPPDRRFSTPPGEGPQNEFTEQEDLGTRDIDGQSAHGIRESQRVAAEDSGKGKEIVISDEYWYSEDLRINLMVKHSDPRTASFTLTVTEITRTEPDAALFEIPPGYRQMRNQ